MNTAIFFYDAQSGTQMSVYGGNPGQPVFLSQVTLDFSLPCPLCGYKIQRNELMRLASHSIRYPKCSGTFDEMGGRKPLSTS
jgi:predicted RNA-binding Zn-ribbon protein involved in translation (DUF1610 family)